MIKKVVRIEGVGRRHARHSPLASIIEATGVVDAVYLSTPITSGRAYLRLEREHFSGDEYRSAVERIKSDHLARASLFAAALRNVHRYVINPGGLRDIRGWGQSDYIALWLEVIERFVTRAFFVDEWNYSRGCSQEFLACLRKGIPALDERGEAITVGLGAALIAEAVVGYDDAGLDASIHRQVLAELENL